MGRALDLVGTVAPSTADEWAANLWCTTRRPGRLRDPKADGLSAHRFDVAVGGKRIAAWDWGEGPTVILAHGWNGQAAQMEAFVAPLVASGHYVVAFDQPAHGRSDGTRTTGSEMADVTLAIGRRVGPVHAVIGHSLGAFGAVLALARGLRAERAVLFAPAADPRTFVELFVQALRLREPRRSGFIDALERRLGALDSYDLRRLVPELRTQALVVHDPADREVPFEHGRSIAESWRGAQLHAVVGAGHRRLLADPKLIREAVEFVRSSRERDHSAAATAGALFR